MSTHTDTRSDTLGTQGFESDLRWYLRGLGGLAVFLLVWWVGAMVTQPSYLVPSPLDSVRAFVDLFATTTSIVVPISGSNLVLPTGLAHLTETLFHYVPGLLLGASCGIGLGLLMGWNGTFDDWLRPLMDADPGTVQSTVAIDVERPRERTAHEFVEYVVQIRAELGEPRPH
ncbi:hypothetical protein U4E84_17370 [Halorubrum sp. AD140]|uniref:ABC transporter permease n=1 Tax=Halorubrum sp. AD140 TaxID=3050073 RepID=UPI002ACCC5BE|nr:hypothetical protein [Halorubrum sp. AD140]MDZ5813106.1 hypothetical protein [Halorubrum sp. AD140]